MSARYLPYFRNCVDWPRSDYDGLNAMIDDARPITRRTFLRNVDRADRVALETGLGYEQHPGRGLTVAGDYHVRYYRAKLHGRRVYFMEWSSIEYVFGEVAA